MNPRMCIMHCPDDARHFLRECADPGAWLLASTHASVDEHLARHGLECLHLARFVGVAETQRAMDEAEGAAADLIGLADRLYADDLADCLAMQPFPFMEAIYGYLLACQYTGRLLLRKAVSEAIRRTGPREIICYDSVMLGELSPFDDLTALAGAASELGVPFSRQTANLRRETGEGRPFARALPKKELGRKKPILDFLKLKLSLSMPRLAILIGPPYDLRFLENADLGAELIAWPVNKLPDFSKPAPAVNWSRLDRLGDPLARMAGDERLWGAGGIHRGVADSLFKHLNHHRDHFFGHLLALDALHRQRKINLGIWGNSPVSGGSGLMVHYLKAQGVPVLGCQHGASYVDQDCRWVHFRSDFSRCTHYLSYGFDGDDVKKAFPDRALRCEVIAAGSCKEEDLRASAAESKQVVDLVYVLQNTLNLGQSIRTNAYTLYQYQRELLEFVDSLAGLRVVIKALPKHNEQNYALRERLTRFAHAQVTEMPFTQFLATHACRAVLVDIPSTPVFEAIGRDTEIFLMTDPVLPFTRSALDLLRKRAYVFDDINDCKQSISLFEAGKLPKLRDQGFYDKYVFRPFAHQKTIDVIDDLLKG